MPIDLTDDKSTLVQVMAWCRQATSHYLSQCWPSSMTPYGVTRPSINLMIWPSSINATHIDSKIITCEDDFDGLVQDYGISIAPAILQPFTKQSIWCIVCKWVYVWMHCTNTYYITRCMVKLIAGQSTDYDYKLTNDDPCRRIKWFLVVKGPPAMVFIKWALPLVVTKSDTNLYRGYSTYATEIETATERGRLIANWKIYEECVRSIGSRGLHQTKLMQSVGLSFTICHSNPLGRYFRSIFNTYIL